MMNFKFSLIDAAKFLICLRTKETKIKLTLYENCLDQLNYYLNPNYYFRMCSANEVQLENYSYETYTAKISCSLNNFQIDRLERNSHKSESKGIDLIPDFAFDYHKN